MESILSTIQGNKLVLVGPNIQLPSARLENVEFANIVDILNADAHSCICTCYQMYHHASLASVRAIYTIIDSNPHRWRGQSSDCC